MLCLASATASSFRDIKGCESWSTSPYGTTCAPPRILLLTNLPERWIRSHGTVARAMVFDMIPL